MRDLHAIIDGLVLEPFMASSAIDEACAELGLSYVGIEADPCYFDAACRRLEAAAGRGPGD